jgi:predicted DNA binding CopG/RHH family protein
MKRKVPRMTTDREAKAFLAKDLSDLEFSQFKPVRFEFEAKSGQLNMRLPQALLEAVKQRAAARGIPYTKFVRQVLEADLVPERAVSPSRAGKRASVGGKSRGGANADSIVRQAKDPPDHLQDVVSATVEILEASPTKVRDQIRPALERIGTAIGHDQAEIRRLSQELTGIRNKLQAVFDKGDDITRENRELKDRVDGLTASVADQESQNKLLQDRLRVLYEIFSRDVAARTQDVPVVSGERH